MVLFRYRVSAEWGHIAFVSAIAITCLIYVLDTLSVSHHVNNIILVVPASGLILLLCVWVLISGISIRKVSPDVSNGQEQAISLEDKKALAKSIALMALTGVYVAIIEFVGLDIASFAYLIVILVLLGERRPIFVLCYALIFTFIVVGGTGALIPYPIPMTFL
jgi:hypothetical protein